MFSKKTMMRLLCLILALLMVVPMLMACDPDEPGPEDNGDETETGDVAITWHMGMVTSAEHEDAPMTLLDGVSGYSYTNVIHIAKKGTKITFVDKNDPSQPDSKYAGENVLVISHWTKNGAGEYELVTYGDNYQGGKNSARAAEFAQYEENVKATYTYVTTYDNEYIRLCYRSGQTAANTEGFTFPTVTVEADSGKGTLESNEKQHLLHQWLQSSADESYFEQLRGLKVVALGDSYFDDPSVSDRLWVDLLKYKYGISLENHGISGSTVAYDTSALPSNSPNPAGGGLREYKSMVQRVDSPSATKGFSQVPDPTVDLVLFDGGRNDLRRGIKLGDATLANNDVATFCGAINHILQKLKTLYPNATIIGITVWGVEESYTFDGVTYSQRDFRDAMVEMCKLNGVVCVDQFDEDFTGVNMNSQLFRAQYCKSSSDVSHLNEKGQKLFFPKIEALLAKEAPVKALTKNLQELKVVTLGDSYFDDPAVAGKLWIDLLAEKYGMSLDNHGISGSTLAYDTRTLPSNSPNPAGGGLREYKGMAHRVKNANATKGFNQTPDPTVDLVLFDGGRNDLRRGIQLGEASLSNKDVATFCGAINSIIEHLKYLYPNALIVGITVWGVNETYTVGETTYKQKDFCDAMMKMCELNGIPCVDQFDESFTGVHMNDAAFRKAYCKSSTDVSHLNAAGQAFYMYVMERHLAREYSKFLAAK